MCGQNPERGTHRVGYEVCPWSRWDPCRNFRPTGNAGSCSPPQNSTEAPDYNVGPPGNGCWGILWRYTYNIGPYLICGSDGPFPRLIVLLACLRILVFTKGKRIQRGDIDHRPRRIEYMECRGYRLGCSSACYLYINLSSLHPTVWCTY